MIRCPSCGKRPRKLMATPAIVFKGGGWYKTDSRAKPKEAGDAGGAKDAASGTSESKSEPPSGAAKDAASAKSDAARAVITTTRPWTRNCRRSSMHRATSGADTRNGSGVRRRYLKPSSANTAMAASSDNAGRRQRTKMSLGCLSL